MVDAHCYLVVRSEKYSDRITGARVTKMTLNPPLNLGADEIVIKMKLNIPVDRFIPPEVPAVVQPAGAAPLAEEEQEDG